MLLTFSVFLIFLYSTSAYTLTPSSTQQKAEHIVAFSHVMGSKANLPFVSLRYHPKYPNLNSKVAELISIAAGNRAIRLSHPAQSLPKSSAEILSTKAETPTYTPLPKLVANAAPSILAIDYFEIFCSNALHFAHYMQSVFGFQPIARCGLETGSDAKVSYVLKQGAVTIVLTSSLNPHDEISTHVQLHGDGVATIGLTTFDAHYAFNYAVKNGAIPFLHPKTEGDTFGTVTQSGIRGYGDTKILFVDRQLYKGTFLPGYVKWDRDFTSSDVGLKTIDHLVGNVEAGKMQYWIKYFQDTLNFASLVAFDNISTDITALASTVLTNSLNTVTFPINEPIKSLKTSQIQEFLDFYGGAGCQHIAFTTDAIVPTIRALRKNGCEFLKVQPSYYKGLRDRCPNLAENIETLQELDLLVDVDEYGYMIQTFTKPIGIRPTLFFEVIQRRGAKSFGKNNFKALFKSIEDEQKKRGTL